MEKDRLFSVAMALTTKKGAGGMAMIPVIDDDELITKNMRLEIEDFEEIFLSFLTMRWVKLLLNSESEE